MTSDKTLVKTEFAPQRSHFVLKQFAQRFDHLEIHLFRQTTDVVVRLDCRRRPFEADRLDHVRIKRSLSKESGIAISFGRRFENLNEGLADNLAFSLRIDDSGQPRQEHL